ncbi:hypothetical protein Tco_0515270 [Tanacetum coccineum]
MMKLTLKKNKADNMEQLVEVAKPPVVDVNNPSVGMPKERRKPYDVKESRIMDMKLRYNIFKFKEGESLTQTFTRYKALKNELVNDGVKLTKLKINTGFINGLPKKWLAFCQSLRNKNHVKESEFASLFDSPDDEEDTRSSQEYTNDLEEEYQARDLLAKSKRDYLSKTLVPSYQSPFQPKLLHSSEHKHELSSSLGKNKGLITKTYDWDEEEVSSDDNKVKACMALTDEERVSVSKESVRNDNSDLSIINYNIPKLSEVDKVSSVESQRNTTDPSFAVTESLATNYDSSNESLVCSTPLPLLKNLDDTKPHHTGQGESSSKSRPSRPAISFPSCIHCGYNDHQSDDCIYYPSCEICRSYDHDTHDHNRVISLRRGIKPRNPQNVTKNCETCASNVHTTADYNDIEWFRKRESSSASRSKTPTKLNNLKEAFQSIKKNMSRICWHKWFISENSNDTPNKLGPDLNGKAVNEA